MTKQTLDIVFAVPYDHKYPLCMLVSKSNVTLVQLLRLKIAFENSIFLRGSHCQVIGACIFMSENEF